ncbi:alpha/beta hydrolase [Carboxylicivirga marina]|uniref:Alpha/beta hydrolase n=1 Tax=Carboxylicivirga marina TaxID=2800988 RepID=A0ABS1HPT1_9BACT|nr:alpha/beta hydrolase [Carboxylicivirga marina]MBK3519238.1 alpha/beta hydrolase [Carboxylicivirga marina]
MKKIIIPTCILLFIILLSSCGSNNKVASVDSQSEIPTVQSTQTYDVLVEEDIVYAQGLSHESINSDNAKTLPLKLDVYTPDNDSGNRPVFVFIHGGGFAGGSKQQGRIIEWANYYTSRGWVFISLDYRLKRDKGTVPQQWLDYAVNIPKNKAAQFLAVYPALRDAKAALRWVVANAEKYKINTEYITLGGGSAGAVSAIAIGITNSEDFRDELTIQQDPSLSSTNVEIDFKVSAIVDLWGSKVALDAMEEIFGHQRFNSNNPPLFIAHGTEDPTVPFTNAEELKTIYETNKVPLAYYPLEGKGHGAWGATVNDKDLAELVFEFIVQQQGINLE